MTRRTISLILDSLMLVAFVALMAWRLTGVPIHEWLAVALLGTIVLHLVIHWDWAVTRLAKLVPADRRRPSLALLLNVALFVAMGVAMASGFYMSKSIFPNHLTSAGYGMWHELHESSSTITLIILGLHVALNWELISNGVRRALRARQAGEAPMPGEPLLVRPLPRILWISVVSAVLAVVVWGGGQVMPEETHEVEFRTADGRTERREPPPDMMKMRPGTDRPNLPDGGPRFLLQSVFVLGVAVVGRRVLKLKLD